MLPIIICDDQDEYRAYLENLIKKDICIEELDMEVVLSAVPNRIKQCLLHARELFSSKSNEVHKTIRLNVGEKVLFLRQKDIVCIQASSNAHKIRIFTHEGIYERAGSLREMAEQLGESFIGSLKSQ